MSEESKPEIAKSGLLGSKRAICAKCGGDRNCAIHGKYIERDGDEFMDWMTEWFILSCLGCDYVFAQKISSNSEDYYHEYDHRDEPVQIHVETVRYWPAVSARQKPEWMTDAGITAEGVERLDAALFEVYGALDAGLRSLSAVGIRTAFDIASELLGVLPDQPFAAKLDALVGAGHIDTINHKRLAGLIEAGNASAHRGWQPETDDLECLIRN